MSIFSCPLCNQPLDRGEQVYRCPMGHCFDISKEGYVHLLPANKKHSALPGDDKDMVRARNRFLSGGFYSPLREALCSLCLKYSPQNCVLLDCGCGEGWYTRGICEALERAGLSPAVYGIDISKEAVRLGAKSCKNAEFAVASAYHLPVANSSVDLLINCFSPLCTDEFERVLKKGGHFIYVVPGPRHLWELKSAVYESPYENRRIECRYDGFSLKESLYISGIIPLPDSQTISDLFTMTPYFWKTPPEGLARLAALSSLETEISFDIYVYEKI